MAEINDETTPLAAPAREPIPKTCALAALALIASAFVPAHPAGSFADLLSNAFQISLMDGVLILFGFGSPYLFALGILGSLPRAVPGWLVNWALCFPITLMTLFLSLIAAVLFLAEVELVGVGSLLGFCVVASTSGVVAILKNPQPSPRHLIRWGAMIVATTMAWCRLQSLVGLETGPAIDLAGLSALAMLWELRSSRGQTRG